MAKNEVGYQHPPKQYRFQPGQSGNPGGRPKKLPSIRDVVAAELAKRVRIADDGLELMVSKQDALIKTLVDAALNGNQRAIGAVIAICEASQANDQHAPDDVDESLLEEFIEREVERRVKARASKEEDPK
jgi:hypothetical protein